MLFSQGTRFALGSTLAGGVPAVLAQALPSAPPPGQSPAIVVLAAIGPYIGGGLLALFGWLAKRQIDHWDREIRELRRVKHAHVNEILAINLAIGGLPCLRRAGHKVCSSDAQSADPEAT
jgi:hypothetical protein